MVDDEGPDDAGERRDDEHRTEGVRIIGAQEAAEAAGRPDVARRRRRGEKRFGDRPDPMEPEPDLPTVRISSSGGIEPVDPSDEFGAPVVRPAEAVHPDPDEPRWGDPDPDALPEPGSERSYGHARVVEPAPTPPAEEPEPADGGWTPEPEVPWSPEPETKWSSEPEVPWSPEPETHWSSGSGSTGAEAPWSAEPGTDAAAGGDTWSAGGWGDEPAAADAGGWTDGGPGDDVPWSPEPAPVADAGDEAFAEPDDEESFVLPHWTEPATGQVPRVVVGDEELEPLTTTGSQPRWRDEGERTVEADFEDLLDDAPRLGALGGDPAAGAEEDFFDGEPDRDPLAAFAPDDDLDLEGGGVATRTRREAPGRRRRPSGPSGDDGGDGGSVGGGDRNLATAVGVGLALALVGLGAFAWGGLPTTVLACVVVGAAAFEFFSAVRLRGHNPAGLLGLVAVVGLLLATYFDGLAAYPVVLGLTVLLGLLWFLWVAPGERSASNLGLTLLGVFWIGLLGSFATLFLGLGRQMVEADDRLTSNPGIGVLIAAVVVAVSHDVGGYFIGRYQGSTPLSAASPNKTLEGLVGGVLTSLVVTVVVIGFVGVSPIGDDLPQAFLFALLCALVAPLGDLCESFIKRDLGIKDMGAALPGHGGVLDRFDSLLFVLPTAYFLTVLFDIWS